MPRTAAASIDHTVLDPSAYDFTKLPDYNVEFVSKEDINAFAKALAGPDPTLEDPHNPEAPNRNLFITALNDWRPIYQRVRRYGKKRRKKPPQRGKDETREGFVYGLLKWPLLVMVLGWLIFLGFSYLLTRFYIFMYEHFVTVRGKRHELRKRMRATSTYEDWVVIAKETDQYLGNDKWRSIDEYAYYNSTTVRNVRDELRRLRLAIESRTNGATSGTMTRELVEDLRALVEGSVKNNFVGVENARLYSETYYGTKDLVQSFIDEVDLALKLLGKSSHLSQTDKQDMYKHLFTNNGKTALCLSGGATFAYYHFGVGKALLDANVLPEVITGTSGGALVAALLATRTDDELKKLLVPALAGKIDASGEPFRVWFPRWWRTGARFDAVDWARRCGWFTRGSLTFREAYERTGRILNVTCIPSDPHSPVVLANYLTAPDCVIWSAVLASAAVPGILPPVVLMKKTRNGTLAPYSLNLKDKWKDGSLRTDIPLRALNTHFNVNFSIVSQVNPHINLFFFSSRGTVGRPVTHRRGRGWRGGYLGSAIEQYLKLDLNKWLKVLRHLELLPRYMGQDWSEIWLQQFSGTVTIWPRSIPSDFINILTDPDPPRLARMIHQGQQSTFPKLKFVRNRMKIERLIEDGRRETTGTTSFEWDTQQNQAKFLSDMSEADMQGLMSEVRRKRNVERLTSVRAASPKQATSLQPPSAPTTTPLSPGFSKRFGGWWNGAPKDGNEGKTSSPERERSPLHSPARRSSVIKELGRQSRVFIDDDWDLDSDAQEMSADDLDDTEEINVS